MRRNIYFFSDSFRSESKQQRKWANQCPTFYSILIRQEVSFIAATLSTFVTVQWIGPEDLLGNQRLCRRLRQVRERFERKQNRDRRYDSETNEFTVNENFENGFGRANCRWIWNTTEFFSGECSPAGEDVHTKMLRFSSCKSVSTRCISKTPCPI